eukprot:123038-Prorocentrum_lima.AAC.1
MAPIWTCLSAQARRNLDYFILSPLLVSMVTSIQAHQECLTRPHRPVQLEMKGNRKPVWQQVLAAPR